MVVRGRGAVGGWGGSTEWLWSPLNKNPFPLFLNILIWRGRQALSFASTAFVWNQRVDNSTSAAPWQCVKLTEIVYWQVLLQVLDFQLSTLPNDFNPGDWVEFTKGPEQHWSEGRRLTGTASTNVENAGNEDFIHTTSSTVNINFQSDSAYEKRGFWIMYKGLLRENRDSCKSYRQHITKHVFNGWVASD